MLRSLKILTVIGARPQLIKAATLSHAIRRHNEANPERFIEEQLLHTGQHYDEQMNDVFIRQLGLPQIRWQLHCGGLSASSMTAEAMRGIEAAVCDYRPDYLLVYGDTTSTLAGALVGRQLGVPVVHVEAGLRSHNMNMPEEVNRILTDHVSTLLFCPTPVAVEHLKAENIRQGVCLTGDIMYDAALHYAETAEQQSDLLTRLNLGHKAYYLCTIHRAENADDPQRLGMLVEAVIQLTERMPVVWPMHPRTRKQLEALQLMAQVASTPSLTVIPPVDYFGMIQLERHAAVILTDSGGVQKEAYFHQTPCVTLRSETEWVETVAAGWNQIAGCTPDKICRCVAQAAQGSPIDAYGNGHAAEQIIHEIVRHHDAHTQTPSTSSSF